MLPQIITHILLTHIAKKAYVKKQNKWIEVTDPFKDYEIVRKEKKES